MERLFSDKNRVEPVAIPADLNAAAVTGKRIKMDVATRLAIIAQFGDSTGAVVQLNLKQHDAESAGNTKALSTKLPWFVKTGSDTEFTKKNAANASISQLDASTELAADEGTVIGEIVAEELDHENGYEWVSVDVADSTAAKIMSAEYVLHEVKKQPAYDLSI